MSSNQSKRITSAVVQLSDDDENSNNNNKEEDDDDDIIIGQSIPFQPQLATKSSTSLQYKNVKVIHNNFNRGHQMDLRDVSRPLKAELLDTNSLPEQNKIHRSSKQQSNPKFRKTNLLFYENVAANLNLANNNADDDEGSDGSSSVPSSTIMVSVSTPPPPPPQKTHMSMNQKSSPVPTSTPPVPPARTKAKKLSPPSHNSPYLTETPSQQPQYRSAIDRNLPQNSKYVEIKLNKSARLDNDAVVTSASSSSSSSPSTANLMPSHHAALNTKNNRNAMLFDGSPLSSTNTENRKQSYFVSLKSFVSSIIESFFLISNINKTINFPSL